jgi:hypothetical protein
MVTEEDSIPSNLLKGAINDVNPFRVLNKHSRTTVNTPATTHTYVYIRDGIPYIVYMVAYQSPPEGTSNSSK